MSADGRLMFKSPGKRPVRIEGAVAFVTLAGGYEAVIDAADAPLVGLWNWCPHIGRRADGSVRTIYAKRREKGRTVFLHRVIEGTPDGLDTDHVDGNGLNNRRSNLRRATRSENNYNKGPSRETTSGVKGVTWNKRRSLWQAQIRFCGRNIFLGCFGRLADAAAAYARASAELHGEFGRTA